MNLKGIEERVADVQAAEESEFLFELLRAYGIPKASITRCGQVSSNRSEEDGEYLWKNKVFYRLLDCPDEELYAAVDAAKAEDRVLRERPRFAIARNAHRLVAADLKPATRSMSRSRSYRTTPPSSSPGQGSRRPKSRTKTWPTLKPPGRWQSSMTRSSTATPSRPG